MKVIIKCARAYILWNLLGATSTASVKAVIGPHAWYSEVRANLYSTAVSQFELYVTSNCACRFVTSCVKMKFLFHTKTTCRQQNRDSVLPACISEDFLLSYTPALPHPPYPFPTQYHIWSKLFGHYESTRANWSVLRIDNKASKTRRIKPFISALFN